MDRCRRAGLTYRVFRADAACAARSRRLHADVGLLRRPTPTRSPTTTPARRTTAATATSCGPTTASPVAGLEPASTVTFDTTPPVIARRRRPGGNGCSRRSPFTARRLTDNSAAGHGLDGRRRVRCPYTARRAPRSPLVVRSVVAADDAPATRRRRRRFAGHICDPTRPPAPVSLEVTTDPAQQKATLSWDPVDGDGAPVTATALQHEGPRRHRPERSSNPVHSVVFTNLQVDATYEFTLDATDVCGRQRPARSASCGSTTPRRRARRSSPRPRFDPAARVVDARLDRRRATTSRSTTTRSCATACRSAPPTPPSFTDAVADRSTPR